MKTFSVDYAIHSGVAGQIIARGTCTVKAYGEADAFVHAQQWVEENDKYYDPRIDPSVRGMSLTEQDEEPVGSLLDIPNEAVDATLVALLETLSDFNLEPDEPMTEHDAQYICEAAAPIIIRPYLDIIRQIDMVVKSRNRGLYPAEDKVASIRSLINTSKEAGIV